MNPKVRTLDPLVAFQRNNTRSFRFVRDARGQDRRATTTLNEIELLFQRFPSKLVVFVSTDRATLQIRFLPVKVLHGANYTARPTSPTHAQFRQRFHVRPDTSLETVFRFWSVVDDRDGSAKRDSYSKRGNGLLIYNQHAAHLLQSSTAFSARE